MNIVLPCGISHECCTRFEVEASGSHARRRGAVPKSLKRNLGLRTRCPPLHGLQRSPSLEQHGILRSEELISWHPAWRAAWCEWMRARAHGAQKRLTRSATTPCSSIDLEMEATSAIRWSVPQPMRVGRVWDGVPTGCSQNLPSVDPTLRCLVWTSSTIRYSQPALFERF